MSPPGDRCGLVVRVLSQILENTVYSFAAVLVVYLVGTAAGAWVYHRRGNRSGRRPNTSRLAVLTSLGCLSGAALLPVVGPAYRILRDVVGPGTAGAVMAEIGVSALVFLPPTLAMGGLFSHLVQGVRGLQRSIGRAFAANTLGSALAPFLFGILLLPDLGPKAALVAVGLGYLMVPLVMRARLEPALLLPVAGAFGMLLAPVSFRFVTLPQGGELLAHRDGVMATVSVVSDRRGHRHLKVNDRFQMGGTSSIYSDRREGHIPLLLHPEPRRALFLGLGAGVTFAAALEHPGLQAEAVELVPEIVQMLPHFTPATGPIESERRLRIRVADARRFVTTATETYDVVIADLFHPARDGAASLYALEHVEAIRGLLGANGVFCQWLPLYQMDIRTLRTIVRTFLRVFPEAAAWLAHYSVDAPILGLIGSPAPQRLPAGWLHQRIRGERHRSALAALHLDEEMELPGAFLGRGESLARFAGEGPINTDDRPVVLFQAPESAYRSGLAPARLVLEVIAGIHAEPSDILALPTAGAAARLRAYWEARDRFLQIGAASRPTNDPRQLLAQVQEPLLSVLQISPDFAPAYRPLVALATAVHELDPSASRALLRRLKALDLDKADVRLP